MRLNFHEPTGRRLRDECVICLTPAGQEGETLETGRIISRRFAGWLGWGGQPGVTGWQQQFLN